MLRCAPESVSATRNHRQMQKKSSPNGTGTTVKRGEVGGVAPAAGIISGSEEGPPVWTQRGTHPHRQGGSGLRWRLAAGAPLPRCLAGTGSPPLSASGLGQHRGAPHVWQETHVVPRCQLRRPPAGGCGAPTAHPERSSEQGQSLRPWTLGCGVAAGGPQSACVPGQSRETPSMGDGECEGVDLSVTPE